MLFMAHLLLLTQKGGKVDAPLLEYTGGTFAVRVSGTTVRVPTKTVRELPRPAVSFRRDEHYAVWDGRGLTIRHGERSHTTRLEDAVTSPRLFEREVIEDTVAKLSGGTRKREAAGLSGALRLGGDAYFLVRWEEKNGTPWTEALVRVPLSGKSLHPEILGRYEGLSIAYKPIDDRLFLFGKQLCIVARQGKTWGIGQFDPSSKNFEFRSVGAELLSYLSTGTKTGIFVERSPYGTVVAGRTDLSSGYRKPVYEARGAARFVDALKPSLVVGSGQGEAKLHNAETGAEVVLPPNSGIGRAGAWVVVWWPAANPTAARLYDPRTWRSLATWPLPKAANPVTPTRTSPPPP